MLSLNLMVKRVGTHAASCVLYYAQRRFSFCQSVFGNSSPATHPATRQRRNAAALLLTRADKCCAEHGLASTNNWAHHQLSNWLQCTLTMIVWSSNENTPETFVSQLNSAQLINETTSWLRFVCQLTVSRPVNSLCKVLFQLSLTVLVCYRCRSRIA